MLRINECKTCNVSKLTCPIAIGLRKKLQDAGINDRLRYKCKDWRKHMIYKVGDKVTFHFIEKGGHGGELSEETLTGIIMDISKKRPVYMVMIDKENRSKIDKEYTAYDRFVTPCEENGDFRYPNGDANFFSVPVKEELITGLSD